MLEIEASLWYVIYTKTIVLCEVTPIKLLEWAVSATMTRGLQTEGRVSLRGKEAYSNMKLSTRARYALRAMLELARFDKGDRPINLNIISEKTSVSRRYLEQVLIPLKNAGLVKGVSGKNGGYLLARAAEEVKIGEIIETAIGKINIVECVNDPSFCMKSERCECRPLYQMINKRVVDAMNEFTLADLCNDNWRTKISGEIGAMDG